MITALYDTSFISNCGKQFHLNFASSAVCHQLRGSHACGSASSSARNAAGCFSHGYTIIASSSAGGSHVAEPVPRRGASSGVFIAARLTAGCRHTSIAVVGRRCASSRGRSCVTRASGLVLRTQGIENPLAMPSPPL